MLADEKPLGLQSWGGGEGSSPPKLPMGKPLSCLRRSLRPCGRRSGVTLQCLTEEGVLVSLLPRALGRAGDRPSLPCLPPPRSGEPGSGQPGAPGSRSAGPPPGAGARKVGQRGSRAPGGFRAPRAERACLASLLFASLGNRRPRWARRGIGVPGKGPDFLSSRPLGSSILLGRRDRRSRLLLPARPSVRTTGPPSPGRLQPGAACPLGRAPRPGAGDAACTSQLRRGWWAPGPRAAPEGREVQQAHGAAGLVPSAAAETVRPGAGPEGGSPPRAPIR